MGTVLNLFDGLRNALTGQGTSRDARSHAIYQARPLTQHEIAAAYSASGIMRKIVKIPALDVVREWRDWTGLDADQMALLYEQEKQHGLRQKIQQVETLRGMGGGALILGLPGNPEEPAPINPGRGNLAYINVVSRWQLSFRDIQDDARQPGYGEPEMWSMSTRDGTRAIHPTRIIPFRADTSAAMAMPGTWSSYDTFWGESVVQQVLDAVKDSDTARASFASMLHKARTLRIGIPGLYEMAAAGNDQQVYDRLAILATAESMHNAVIYDSGDVDGKGGEEISDATYSFAGAKDIMNAYAEFVAAISDIPATRLLGRAPEGMNSSGDSQQADWNKKIRAHQTLDLASCLDRLDRYLVPSALGSTPDTLAYDFAPLDTPDQEKVAARFKVQMEAAEKLQLLGAVPEEAFNRGLQSLMIEEGYLPELEAALGEMSDEERYGILPAPGAEESEVIEQSAEEGGSGNRPAPRAVNDLAVAKRGPELFGDAAPRTLYVSRSVVNAADIIAHYKAQGIETTLPAADLHVTVAFSRTPLDWMTISADWSGDKDGRYTVPAGGPRQMDMLGDMKDVLVLLFNDDHLRWRHEHMIDCGASWDWPEYQPHITISYSGNAEGIEPWDGPIVLGPERFAEVDENWKSKIEEA